MSTPKLLDVTPFNPMIIKVHYDGFDWEKLKPVCQSMIDGIKDAGDFLSKLKRKKGGSKYFLTNMRMSICELG